METPGEPNSQSVAYHATASGLYILQLTNCSSGDTESVPLQLLVDEIVQKSASYAIQAGTEELQRPPPFNPICSDLDGVKYCISNEELHKVIPKRKSDTPLPLNILAPQTQPEQPSAPSIITEVLEKRKKPVVPKKKKSKVAEDIRSTLSKTIIPSFFAIPDRTVPPRAVAVLPGVLQLRRGTIYPGRSLPPNIKFGPVQGIRTKIFHAEGNEILYESILANKPVFFLKREDNSVVYIDVADKDKSNWIGLLPLGTQETANVWLIEEEDELYAITVKPIRAKEPLKLGYSKQYAVKHNIPDSQPILDLEAAFPKAKMCHQCLKTFTSEAILKKHIMHCDKGGNQRRYRCKFCSKTFAKLFSLRRHKSRYCTKMAEKLNETKSTIEPEQKTDLELFTQSMEENKIPSDESFHQFTNGLDFSTNLFDTDRIPNLDISGCSRSDVDFNSYGEFRDELSLGNDVDYAKFSSRLNASSWPYSDSSTSCKNKRKTEEAIIVSCPYCDKTIAKTKRRQHLRVCPKRRFHCDCGQSFNRKDRIAQHIHTVHGSKANPATNTDNPYDCEVCGSRFKRRGMLINHLWRVHKRRSQAVPLEKPVRYFPCSGCTKVYRSAAKREVHAKRHHPGCKTVAPPIEVGLRAAEPASCALCPRQYATRAKLLQHWRAKHPLHIPPKPNRKKTETVTGNNTKLPTDVQRLLPQQSNI